MVCLPNHSMSEANMNDWVKAQLAEIGQAEAPEMLTPAEIKEELVELLGEEESDVFCAALVKEQERRSASTSVSKTRGSRSGEGDNRRDDRRGGEDKRDDRRGKRERDEEYDNSDKRIDIRSRLGGNGEQVAKRQHMQDHESSSTTRGSSASNIQQMQQMQQMQAGMFTMDPATMQQQMLTMAQMAGFESPEAMLAAQQQMMRQMMGDRGTGGRSGGNTFGRGRGRGRDSDSGRGRGRDSGRGRGRDAPVHLSEKARSYVAPHLKDAARKEATEKAKTTSSDLEKTTAPKEVVLDDNMTDEQKARATHPGYQDFDEGHEAMGSYYAFRGSGGRGRGRSSGRGRGRGRGPFAGRGRGSFSGRGRGGDGVVFGSLGSTR